MEIANSFVVDAPVDVAWTTLTDIPFIAPCMPGATLTGSEGDKHEGQVKIKVGPITATYKGSAVFVEKDDVAHRAVIDGRGRDARGAGNANAMITAQMTPQGANSTRVDITTELKITGKVAQFGRGVMQDVSEKLLGQFADCLAAKMAELPATDAAAAPDSAASAIPADAPPPPPIPEGMTGGASTAPKPSTPSTPPVDNVVDVLDVAGDAAWKRLAPALAGLVAALGIFRFLRRKR